MLYEWLNRSHIVEWWGGEEARPTLADVQEQYFASVLSARVRHSIHCNAELESRLVCPVVRCSWKRGRMVGRRNRSRSTRNRPVTGECINWAKAWEPSWFEHWLSLFNDPEVTKIQTDPSPSNLRAIRCYEKAGFERQGTVTTPDGPAVYMVCKTRRHSSEHAVMPNPSIEGTSKGWRPWPPLMSNVRPL